MTVKEPKFNNIPHELTEYHQWICWKEKKRDNGKTDKKPINPKTGSYAKTNDPSTWGKYSDAVACYSKNKGEGISGIGFVFTKDDPFCGIDLDDCIESETGKPFSWAEEILNDFNSYAEISPSGKGIKIFCKGKLPNGAVKTKNIEMYDSGRFFTVTGVILE
jgi:putative DNA primase/helicase